MAKLNNLFILFTFFFPATLMKNLSINVDSFFLFPGYPMEIPQFHPYKPDLLREFEFDPDLTENVLTYLGILGAKHNANLGEKVGSLAISVMIIK